MLVLVSIGAETNLTNWDISVGLKAKQSLTRYYEKSYPHNFQNIKQEKLT